VLFAGQGQQNTVYEMCVKKQEVNNV